MTPHDNIQKLLALSVAGLLEAGEERQVREHLGNCAECSAMLDLFREVAAELRTLPAPPVPQHVTARVNAEIAAYADRRQGAWLAAGSAGLAWLLALASLLLFRMAVGDPATLRVAGWLIWSTVPAGMAASVAAGLAKRRERRLS
jgi:anti-sigma factor RsiW